MEMKGQPQLDTDAVIGVDFGTTNTVISAVGSDGSPKPLELRAGGNLSSGLRTTLGFRAASDNINHIVSEAGELAVEQFIDDPEGTRFLQSIKTYAASKLFTGTRIHRKHFDYEDLMQTFLECFWRYAGGSKCAMPRRLVVGRPVEYAGSTTDADLAMKRYCAAFARLGVQELIFVYEPVGAAYFFARQLTESATVLVADFGGGTTDYSIVRFEVGNDGLVARSLGHGGVGIAGDQFDYRIVENLILPELGKGSFYNSMGRKFMVPGSLFGGFARWDRLSVFESSREFRELKKLLRLVENPEKIERLIELVESNQGHPLYRSVSDAKTQLSLSDETILRSDEIAPGFERSLRRAEFETWIAEDLARMDDALVRTLEQAGITEREVDQVFLTGGTSFVPAVRNMLASRFGEGRLHSSDQMVSIASGLALIGASDDPVSWTVGGRVTQLEPLLRNAG